MLMLESEDNTNQDSNRLAQIFRGITGGTNQAISTASSYLEQYGRVLLRLQPQHVGSISKVHLSKINL